MLRQGPTAIASSEESQTHVPESFLVSVVSIYLLYGLKYLFPLLVAPLLAAKYGVAYWGAIAIQLSIAQTVNTIVDYGFSVSAVRDCALCADLPEIKVLYGRVVSASLAVSLLLLIGYFCSIPLGLTSQTGVLIPLMAILWGILQGVSPGWYFQATGRFRLYVGIDGVSKLLLVAALIFFSPRQDGMLFVIGSFLAAGVLAFVISAALTIRYVGFPMVSVRTAISGLRHGFPIFAFRGLASLYTTINVPFVGYLLGKESAGIYALVERLVRGILGLVTPLGQILLPRMSRLLNSEAVPARRQMFWITVSGLSLATITAAATAWRADLVARMILKLPLESSVSCLRAMAGLIPLGVLTHLVGVQWLLPNRDDRYFLLTISCGAVVSLICLPLLSHFFGLNGAASCAVLVEGVVAALFVFRIIVKSGIVALSDRDLPDSASLEEL